MKGNSVNNRDGKSPSKEYVIDWMWQDAIQHINSLGEHRH